jgi:hypothetical protein
MLIRFSASKGIFCIINSSTVASWFTLWNSRSSNLRFDFLCNSCRRLILNTFHSLLHLFGLNNLQNKQILKATYFLLIELLPSDVESNEPSNHWYNQCKIDFHLSSVIRKYSTLFHRVNSFQKSTTQCFVNFHQRPNNLVCFVFVKKVLLGV